MVSVVVPLIGWLDSMVSYSASFVFSNLPFLSNPILFRYFYFFEPPIAMETALLSLWLSSALLCTEDGFSFEWGTFFLSTLHSFRSPSSVSLRMNDMFDFLTRSGCSHILFGEGHL
jgi:hypothetical protein